MIRIFKQKSSSSDELCEVLFKEHYTKVYQILCAKFNNNSDLSEEATQEAFCSAFNKLDQLEDKSRFLPWVTRIAINKANDILRKNAGYKITILNDYTYSDIRTEKEFSRIESRDEIFRILANFSPDERDLLIYKYFLDMTTEEIAAALDTTPNNAKSRLYRAKEHYKKVARPEDGQSLKEGGASNGSF